ncbi:MAG: ComF family protein [Firmicutes bacterium]|nr:ComF family protein [Bacillota bacterium]
MNFLFPHFTCLACDGEINVSKHSYICDVCFEKFIVCNPARASGQLALSKKIAPNSKAVKVSYIYSPFYYAPPLSDIILKLKYANEGLVAKLFAPLMVSVLDKSYDVVIPIPLSKGRERERGFNQAMILARDVGSLIEIPVMENILVKIKNTAPQVNMSHEERLDNQKDSYSVIDTEQVKDKRIILVDDVLTSGATANECARILKRAGAKMVSIVTIARVKPSKDKEINII